MHQFILSVTFFALALGGCASKTTTITTETPNGITKVSENSHHRTVSVQTVPAYRDCVRMHAATYGTSQADLICRGVTSGGIGGAPMMYGYGDMSSVTGVMAGGGMVGMAPIVLPNGQYAPPPGNGIVVMTDPEAEENKKMVRVLGRAVFCLKAEQAGRPCPAE